MRVARSTRTQQHATSIVNASARIVPFEAPKSRFDIDQYRNAADRPATQYAVCSKQGAIAQISD